MTLFELLLPKSLPGNKFFLISFFALAVAGFADSLYLSLKHFIGEAVTCGEGWFVDCNQVLASSYAAIGGVPVALIGVFYYTLILVLVVLYLDRGNLRILRAARNLTLVGLAGTLWFTFVQVFILKALCPYCLVSAVSSLGLGLIAWGAWRRL